MSEVILLTRTGLKKSNEVDLPKRVMIESPLAGSYDLNVEYARLAIRHSLIRLNESPMAFHLIYNKALRDGDQEERMIGIKKSFDWHSYAEKKVFYVDRGISNGMIMGYLDAKEKGIETEFRVISTEKQINSFINQFNNRSLSLKEIEDLSKTLKHVINGRGDGYLTGYKEEFFNEIEKIKKINEEEQSNESKVNCLLMRKLLLEDKSPLMLDEFYSQIVSLKEKEEAERAAESWSVTTKNLIVIKEEKEEDFCLKDIEIIRELNTKGYFSKERALGENIHPSNLMIEI